MTEHTSNGSEGKCPGCGSVDIYYGSTNIYDGYTIQECECEHCEINFDEVCTMVYSNTRWEIDDVEDIKPSPTNIRW